MIMQITWKKLVRLLAMAFAITAVLCIVIMTQRTEVCAAGYSSAPTIQFDGQWTGQKYITPEDWYGETWYKVVAAEDGEYEMRIMTYSEDSVNWELKSKDLSQDYYEGAVNCGTETSPRTEVWNMPLKKGTYYLKMYISSDETIKYKMKNTFTSYGTNDAYADSFDSPQNYSIGTKVTGLAAITDQEDWFKFTVPKKSILIMNMKTYHEEGVGWEIYNHDLTEKMYESYVNCGSFSSPASNKEEVVIPAGTFYLKVKNTSFWGSKYVFTLEWLTQSNCIHEYDYTMIYPTYFAKGYDLHKCRKCGKTYKSDYSPFRKLDTPYIYMISPRKKKARVIWYGQDSNSSGYQIRYSRSKKMSNSKTQTIKGKNKDRKEIKKLASKKKYYFQVRAFKKSGNKTAYSSWSGKRSTKVK